MKLTAIVLAFLASGSLGFAAITRVPAQPEKSFTPAQIAASCAGVPAQLVKAIGTLYAADDPENYVALLAPLPTQFEGKAVTVHVPGGGCRTEPFTELPVVEAGKTVVFRRAIGLIDKDVLGNNPLPFYILIETQDSTSMNPAFIVLRLPAPETAVVAPAKEPMSTT